MTYRFQDYVSYNFYAVWQTALHRLQGRCFYTYLGPRANISAHLIKKNAKASFV